jgi:hypothetical protein
MYLRKPSVPERNQIRSILTATVLSVRRAEHMALLGGYDSEDEANYVVSDRTKRRL